MIIQYCVFMMICILISIWKMYFEKCPENERELLSKEDSVSLRGIAALFVMLAHYAIWIENDFGVDSDAIFLVPKQLGGMGVLIFFFLSGYGIYMSTYKNEDIKIWWLVKKIEGVYIPYVFIKIILEIIAICLGVRKFKIFPLFLSVTGLDLCDWFVVVIIIQYVLYYISSKLTRKHVFAAIFVLSCIVMGVFIWLELETRWYNGLLLFWFGAWVAYRRERLSKYVLSYYLLKMIIMILFFMILAIIYIFQKGMLYVEIFKIMAGMILNLLLIFVITRVRLESSVLKWIGKRSLYIYIIHMHVWGIITKICNKTILLVPFSILISFVLTGAIFALYNKMHRFLLIRKCYEK